jgi:ADP-ribosyl-[dinitrogen reductase] hydrolase
MRLLPILFAFSCFEFYSEKISALHDEYAGNVFDVRVRTAMAIEVFYRGTPALRAGFAKPEGKGNGALMLVLPFGALAPGHNDELELTEEAYLVIYSHSTCAMYCILNPPFLESGCAWADAVETLHRFHVGFRPPQRTGALYPPDEELELEGRVYLVRSLWTGRWAIRRDSYEQVVKAAVSLGGDTDTNASVAGGLAGIRDGQPAIPAWWLKGLRGKEIVQPLL